MGNGGFLLMLNPRGKKIGFKEGGNKNFEPRGYETHLQGKIGKNVILILKYT